MRSRSPTDESRDRHRHRRRSRSRCRDRSRSRSRGRARSRSHSTGRDFRPHKHRRSRTHSRSRSRSRGGHHSPHRRHVDRQYDRSPPGAWGPGAGGAGPPAAVGGLPPWKSERGLTAGPTPPWREHQPGDVLPPGPDDHAPADWAPPDDADRGESGYDEWARSRSRGVSRGSDTDRDWDMEREIEWSRRLRGPETPTASIFIKGLPDDADESDIHRLFEAYPNIQSVKVLRDRQSGRSKGMAFVDFASADDARLLMESEQRWTMAAGGQRLLLDYSHGAPGSRGGGSGEPGSQQAQDWICDMCSAVNFARRLECYHCYTARPANPRRVTADLNEPSCILKVSGLEPSTSEEALYQLCAAVVPNIVDLRVIKDKYTGAPRGFAFVELASIPEAGSLMLACQGQLLPGQSTPLKICYAKAKEKLLGSATGPDDVGGAVSEGADAAGAAAGPPAAVLGWKPKEFDASAVLDESNNKGSGQGQEPQQQQAGGSSAAASAGAGAGAAGGAAAAAGDGAAGPGPGSEAAAASAAAAAAAGVDAATIQALTQAGFEYQPSSGYWYDAKSGYYYDTRSQLYYHHSTNQWYQYNHSTGQYTAVGGEQQQQQQAATAGPAEAPGMQQQPQQQQQQPPQRQPPQRQTAAADKRRRAVIGSAPQYNPEGLLAAAALAKERDEEQKRLGAAKAARERQQQQQNKHVQKPPQLMPGKPGIGMMPGTGSAPLPAAAQVVADGQVQGVVYKSKWAQKRQGA